MTDAQRDFASTAMWILVGVAVGVTVMACVDYLERRDCAGCGEHAGELVDEALALQVDDAFAEIEEQEQR